VPVRVAVKDFVRRRTMARIWKDNETLLAIKSPARATTEQYELFSRYQQSRHAGSDMALMGFYEYSAMVEDRAIAEIVKFQADVGLQSITDGEFRRTYFHIDFLEQLGGVKTDIPVTIVRPDGTEELAPPVIRVIDKVRHAKNIQLADFQYLKGQVDALGLPGVVPKVTIPSPTMLHFRGGRAGISKEAYPELDPVFYDDVAKAYGEELQSLADAGCTYR
jgi:methionine synthase II (cobalamin-independent)